MDLAQQRLAFQRLCYLFTALVLVSPSPVFPSQPLSDGETVVSQTGIFEMGFFSPAGSQSRYFGIWYKIISTGTLVWVANRDAPINGTTGAFQLLPDGNLAVFNARNGTVVWSSGGAFRFVQNPVAELLDSGNLVVRDGNEESFLWQSFDHPTDTALPGMKMGKNLITGLDRVLTSWKTTSDPSPGNFSFQMNTHGFPQLFLLQNGYVERRRIGPWNGEWFSGSTSLRPNLIYSNDFVFNDTDIYYSFNLVNSSIFNRLIVSPSGFLQRLIWNIRNQTWTTLINLPSDSCDYYGVCHGNGACDIDNAPICSCFDRFKPRMPDEWGTSEWSSGCTRRTPPNCKTDGFIKYSGLKLPDTRNSWYNKSTNLEDCEKMCLRNCSCTAYSNLDITHGGSGCLLWFNDLVDIKNFRGDGLDLYVRMANSEIGSGRRKSTLLLVLITGILLPVLLLVWCLWRRKKKLQETELQQGMNREETLRSSNSWKTRQAENGNEDLELQLFDLNTILRATDNFSLQNKIGEGGFGPVYKGLLVGKEIAVKRLSKYSKQGLEEFKNEVKLIAKLQHRNLVRLLGCCIADDERMLVYEFMPNNSLATMIFDENQSKLLDWPVRFRIIKGIARGLLYLHQDSRLRIIHRDLKADNILLDEAMNPKISDFGMARSFIDNETEACTKRVVGTYGYMSPEYAIDGQFSAKSDVYSFGVLVLEIISGTRNRGFRHHDHHHNLLGHAWILHGETRALELMSSNRGSSSSSLDPRGSSSRQVGEVEVMRTIHVALLCVQTCPSDRPDMGDVVVMLAGEGPLPEPKEPGFFTERNLISSLETTTSGLTLLYSGNEITITQMEPR